MLRVTRSEAVARALAFNPSVRVAMEQTEQARARVHEATAFPDPSFSVNVLGQNSLFGYNTSTETDLLLGLTVPFPQKFSLRGRAAEGELGGFEAATVLQRQLIASQTSQAYDSLLVALRHRVDLEVARGLSQDFLKKTEARFQGGTAARLDVVKAQVDVAQSENDLIANERGIANARAALNRLLGRTLGAPIEAADSLGIPTIPTDFDRLERVAMERRPELAGVRRQQAGARAATQLAQQYFLPDLQIGLQQNHVYGTPNTYETAIGVDVPLLFWQHQKGEVAEAKHRELELSATERDLIAQVGQDLRNAYAAATISLRQAVFLRDELLPSAEQQYRIASASYGLGGSSALEVIDAHRTLLDARAQYVAALGALNDAVADLERAVGAPLDTVPSDSTGTSHD